MILTCIIKIMLIRSDNMVKKEMIAEGVYKLTAVVGNTGFMPTYVLKEGLKNRKLKKLTVCMRELWLIPITSFPRPV